MLKRIFIALALTLSLAACPGFGPIHKDTATVIQQDPVKGIRYALDEFNAGVAAVATALVHDYHEGVWTREEIQEYFTELNVAVLRANEAENFLDLGNALKAKDRLDLAQTMLTTLQQKLVALKNKRERT